MISPIKLYLKNENDIEELLDDIIALFPSDNNQKSYEEVDFSKYINNNKIIICKYSRENDILKANDFFKFRLMSSNLNQNKLEGFGKYLQDRKKAAIFSINNNVQCYILPPQIGRDIKTLGLSCISKINFHETSKLNLPRNLPDNKPPNKSITEAKTQNTDASSKSKPGFLSNLLSKVETANKDRKPQSNRNNEVCDQIRSLEIKLRAQIDEFIADVFAFELELEPMDRDKRFICHDVVQDYPELVSASVGEDDLRHIVVYKKGHEPVDVEINLPSGFRVATGAALTNGKRPKKDEVYQKPIAITNFDEVIQVGTVKRDRRTIEEIQQDMKRSKLEGRQFS